MSTTELLSAFGSFVSATAADPKETVTDTTSLSTNAALGGQDATDTAILSANDQSAVQVARDDSGLMTPRPLITEDNLDTVLANSGGVPLYAKEYAQDPASFLQ